jgi:hypothetical protein
VENRLRTARAVALGRLSAWIAHLSYANLAGIATFSGRYVVGLAQTAVENVAASRFQLIGSQCRGYASRGSAPP